MPVSEKETRFKDQDTRLKFAEAFLFLDPCTFKKEFQYLHIQLHDAPGRNTWR
jgi:hypothetical protein